MKCWIVLTAVFALIALTLAAAIPKDKKKDTSTTLNTKKDNTSSNIDTTSSGSGVKHSKPKHVKKPSVSREGRQIGGGIGYGGQLAGLQSALQGISSGYGYGYNNAVGLGGLGMNNGYGLAIPLGFGYGR